jgi:hypothetical protein
LSFRIATRRSPPGGPPVQLGSKDHKKIMGGDFTIACP